MESKISRRSWSNNVGGGDGDPSRPAGCGALDDDDDDGVFSSRPERSDERRGRGVDTRFSSAVSHMSNSSGCRDDADGGANPDRLRDNRGRLTFIKNVMWFGRSAGIPPNHSKYIYLDPWSHWSHTSPMRAEALSFGDIFNVWGRVIFKNRARFARQLASLALASLGSLREDTLGRGHTSALCCPPLLNHGHGLMDARAARPLRYAFFLLRTSV